MIQKYKEIYMNAPQLYYFLLVPSISVKKAFRQGNNNEKLL